MNLVPSEGIPYVIHIMRMKEKIKEIDMSIFGNIGKAFTYAKTILAIYPELMELIKAIEVPGNGSAKLSTVLSLVLPVFDALPEDLRNSLGGDNLKSLITGAINTIVAFFNLTGMFKK